MMLLCCLASLVLIFWATPIEAFPRASNAHMLNKTFDSFIIYKSILFEGCTGSLLPKPYRQGFSAPQTFVKAVKP